MIQRNYGLPRRIPFLLMGRIRGSMIIFGGRDSGEVKSKIRGLNPRRRLNSWVNIDE